MKKTLSHIMAGFILALAASTPGFTADLRLNAYDVTQPNFKVGLNGGGSAVGAAGLYDMATYSAGGQPIFHLSGGMGAQMSAVDDGLDLTANAGFCTGGGVFCLIATTKPFDGWGGTYGAMVDTGRLWSIMAGAGNAMTSGVR